MPRKTSNQKPPAKPAANLDENPEKSKLKAGTTGIELSEDDEPKMEVDEMLVTIAQTQKMYPEKSRQECIEILKAEQNRRADALANNPEVNQMSHLSEMEKMELLGF